MNSKFVICDTNNYKKSVLFIHGFNKKGDQWNITEFGKEIGIESHIRKTHNTILLSLDDKDYLTPISDVSIEIYENIKHLSNTKFICVTHSYGAIFATYMAIKYPTLFHSIIMLDPTIKTNNLLKYFKSLEYNEKTQYKIDNFDKLPNYLEIPKNIIIKIHLNIDDNTDINKIIKYDALIKLNMKSRLMIHANIGHMIHYKIPHIIIDTIKSI
jgi:pimeloyl-ACP methyl ester carboxylesterase